MVVVRTSYCYLKLCITIIVCANSLALNETIKMMNYMPAPTRTLLNIGCLNQRWLK